MSLRARLLLVGAVLPTLALVVALLIARVAFSRELVSAIDDGMRTQAAVEIVSMFDRPGRKPHLHLRSSPLAAGADPSAAAVYDLTGEPVERWPDDAVVPEAHDVASWSETPTLATVRDEHGVRRELRVAVTGPDGTRYGLWLGHDLAPHEATLAAYDRTSAIFVLAITLLLLAIQIAHARWLDQRIDRLAAHMARLREGQLDAVPPPDQTRDRIGDLRDSIADATLRLRAASEARDRLVSDAAHELRTPLATMRAGIDVTLRRDRSASELRQELEHLREEVDRLSATAADLLELAGGARAHEEVVATAIDELVDAAIAAGAAHARFRDVSLARSGQGGTVRVAQRSVRRAVDNLLANAIAFAPPGSRVDVVLERTGDTLRIQVADRGPGIPESEREAIFEPFHRADRSRPGTGLGLAIVRDVARRHGGRAYAKEREGGGAEVVVELPVGA